MNKPEEKPIWERKKEDIKKINKILEILKNIDYFWDKSFDGEEFVSSPEKRRQMNILWEETAEEFWRLLDFFERDYNKN